MNVPLQQQLEEILAAGYPAQLGSDGVTITVILKRFPHKDFSRAEVQWQCSGQYPHHAPQLQITVDHLSNYAELESSPFPVHLSRLAQWSPNTTLLELTRMVEAELQAGRQPAPVPDPPMPDVISPQPTPVPQRPLPIPDIHPYPSPTRPVQPSPRPRPVPRPTPNPVNPILFIGGAAVLLFTLILVSIIALVSSPPPPQVTDQSAPHIQSNPVTPQNSLNSPTSTTIPDGFTNESRQQPNTTIIPTPAQLPTFDTRTLGNDFRGLWQTYDRAVATAQQQPDADATAWNEVVAATDGLVVFWNTNRDYQEELVDIGTYPSNY
ncbi:hypothetical protein HC928_07240 [bacterium]|nr:hypothetical protein [bacterium]